MHVGSFLFASTLTLVVAACSPSTQEGKSPAGTASASLLPSQADMDRIAADPLPAARQASALEYWAHYKLMQATGLAQTLGGEERAVTALKAVGMAFERASIGAQARVPRMIPAAFDGTGLDAGMMGAGYGLVGGALTGSLLNGGLSESQIAEAARNGPIKFDGEGNSAQLDVAQDGMDTTLEQTVNENGVTGKVRTHIHIDACPDAEGKLTVTIETESRMGAGGKTGAVTLRYRQERFLDDDAHLLPLAEDGKVNGSEFFQIDMKGTGANGELSYYEDGGFGRDGQATGGTVKESGHSIFRPEEAAHTTKMVQGAQNLMRAFAQMMLQGSFGGGTAPWESGRCVDLKLRSSPEKRRGAKPDTHYTLFAEPRAKKDGAPTGGTVKATLTGAHALSPQDKVKADAQFDYQNPKEKDQSASIQFTARSKRGVGKGTLVFDTKKSGYRITATGDGACAEPITVCDITQPFTNTICDGAVTWTHTPTSDKGGDFTFRYAKSTGRGKGNAEAKGTYTLSGPEEKMSSIYQMGKICGHAAGMTVCTPPRTFGAMTWTQIDDCGE